MQVMQMLSLSVRTWTRSERLHTHRLGRYSGNIRAIDRMEKMLRKMLDVTV